MANRTIRQDERMKRKYNKRALITGIICLVILMMEFSFYNFLPGWTFKTKNLVILNEIIYTISFFTFIFFTAMVFRPPGFVRILIGVLFLFLCGLISCMIAFPIDTTTQPVDKQVLQTYSDGKKLVLREYKNAKTNEAIQDTVLVKDVSIFRYIYPAEKSK